MALAVNMTDKWIIGGVAQHWWSFAGDDDVDRHTNLGEIKVDRPDVNLYPRPIRAFTFNQFTTTCYPVLYTETRLPQQTRQANTPI